MANLVFKGQGANGIGKFLATIWNDEIWERNLDENLWQIIASKEVQRRFQEHYDYCNSLFSVKANEGLRWEYTTTRGTKILLSQSNRLIWDEEEEDFYSPPLYWEVHIPPEREGGYHHSLAKEILGGDNPSALGEVSQEENNE